MIIWHDHKHDARAGWAHRIEAERARRRAEMPPTKLPDPETLARWAGWLYVLVAAVGCALFWQIARHG